MTHAPPDVPRAYLLVDHGSRVEAANEVVASVARAMQERLGGASLVAYAHQEAAPPCIDEAIDALAARGVRSLVVIPFFLAPGRHASVDVPRLAREAAARHEGLEVHVVAPPLPARPADLAALLLAALEAT